MTESKRIIIVVGYPKPIEEFLRLNPGLSSRFGYRINLEGYRSEELVQMFKNKCLKSGSKLEDEETIAQILTSHFINISHEKDLGNGRYVETFFSAVLGKRLEVFSEDASEADEMIRIEYIMSAIKKDGGIIQ